MTDRNERLVEIVKASIMHRLPRDEAMGSMLRDVKAAWAEDCARNAVQAMQGVIGSCPRCQAQLPQYEGLCRECSRAPDHEEE